MLQRLVCLNDLQYKTTFTTSWNQYCSCSKYLRPHPIYWRDVRVQIEARCVWWCFNALTVQVPEPHLEILLRRCCCDPMSRSCRAKSWLTLKIKLRIEHKLHCKARTKNCALSTCLFPFTWGWCWSAELCSAFWLRCHPCCFRLGPLFSDRCCCPGRWPARCPETAVVNRSGTETAGPGEQEECMSKWDFVKGGGRGYEKKMNLRIQKHVNLTKKKSFSFFNYFIYLFIFVSSLIDLHNNSILLV